MTTATTDTRSAAAIQWELTMKNPLSMEFTPDEKRDVIRAMVAYGLAHKNVGGVAVFAGICREWVEAHDRQQAAIRNKRPAFTPVPCVIPEPDPLALVSCHGCTKRDEPHRMRVCPSCRGTFCEECDGQHECDEFKHHPYGR